MTQRPGAVSFEIYEAICNLKYNYAHALDNKDWALMRSCFADDAEFEVPSTGPVHGADNAVRTLSDRFDKEFAFTLHECTMPQLTLLGPNEAEGSWDIHTLTITFDAMKLPEPVKINGYGRYHERYRKIGGAWKISRLRLVPRFKDGRGLS